MSKAETAETLARQIEQLPPGRMIAEVAAILAPHLAGAETLPPHKRVNFLTVLEHQIYRNHLYGETCPECKMSAEIAAHLRSELLAAAPPEGEQS